MKNQITITLSYHLRLGSFLSIWIFFLTKIVVFAAAPQELVLLNWSDYLDPEVVESFEKKFNAQIKEIYFLTEEHETEILIDAKGKGFDLVLMSNVSVNQYVKLNWIAPLDFSKIPNIKHVDSKILNMRPALKQYVVPYLWGTIGIGYRQDLVKTEVTSWKQLYQPEEYLKGKLYMIDDLVDIISLAFKGLGYSRNDYNNPQALQVVENLLVAQKPYVKEYTYVDITNESALVSGDIWMTMIYNGDALALQEIDPNIVYSLPKEGSMIWVDDWMIMQHSSKKELAHKFLNFIHDPQNAAKTSATLYFATTNKTAKKFLSQEHLNDPVIYPSSDVLEKSDFMTVLPPRTIKKWNTIYSKIKD